MTERKVFNETTGGWVTVQNDLNQSEKTAAWLRNAYMMKDGTHRRRQGYNKVLSNFSPDKPVWNVIPYVSIGGKEEWLFQVEEKWYRLESNGSTTQIAGLNDTEKHYTTQFNGRLIMGNKKQDPHKYFYLKAPEQATTSSIAGNNASGEPARTYYVKITYSSSNGETDTSVVKRQDVKKDEWLKITSPVSQEGAQSWNLYVSETKGKENQQGSGLTIGDDWNEEDDGKVNDTGTADYPTENKAWEDKSLGGGPPRAEFWETHNGRVFAGNLYGDTLQVNFSGLNDEDSWGTNTKNAADPGILEFDLKFGKGDNITGLGSIQDRLVVFFEEKIAVLNFPEDATAFTIAQIMKGLGCVSHESIVSLGGDMLWLSKYGVQSISQEFGTTNLLFDDENPSSPINNVLANDAQNVVSNGDEHTITADYFPLHNWYMLCLPEKTGSNDVVEQRIYVYDIDYQAWTHFDGIEARSIGVDRNENIYFGEEGSILDFWDGTFSDENNSYPFEWASPWFYLSGPSVSDQVKEILFPVVTDQETNIDVTLLTDLKGKTDTYTQTITTTDQSEFSTDTFSDGIYSDNIKNIERVPFNATANAYKAVFESTDKADLQIPWFEIVYSQGGTK